MALPELVDQNVSTIAAILAAMGVVAILESAIPLHTAGSTRKAHLKPNLALTFITFATNIFFNLALLLAMTALRSNHFGLLHLLPVGSFWAAVIAVIGLDFSSYVAHVAMHKIPAFWRFHQVHHSDPEVDVTTTIRQHPGEGVIRFAFMAAFAVALGPSPAAFAVYRLWSALSGLMEHANIRVPRQVDVVLSLITTWPNMHKVHHSRNPLETDTNYGNIFSWFDRLFRTFTPSERGTSIVYGLDGLDDTATQTTAGLLALPFRESKPANQGVDRVPTRIGARQ